MDVHKKTPRLQTELCTYGEKRTFRPDLTNDEKTQDFTSQNFRDKVSKVNNNKFESRKIRIYRIRFQKTNVANSTLNF